MNLHTLTLEIKSNIEKLKERYETSERPEDKRDRDFFAYVKAETTPMYNLIQQWDEEARQFVQNREVNVHPQQVASTTDNLELLLMHSYYIDVRRKRYMELFQSVQYVLDQLLHDIIRVGKHLNNR